VVGGEWVVRAIGSKFSEIEIASEDSVGVVGMSRQRGHFRSPDTFIRAVQIAINNVELFARSTAGKGGLDGRTLVDD
jgi:hypothetical protein